jgi:predicted extracellular nuclease
VSRRLRLVGCLVGLLLLLVGVQGAGGAPTELFFSEYIEGSSNNKALEIYNGTGATVDLTAGAYNVQMYFNGNPSAGLTINLTGAVADGDVYVLAHESANPAILAEADQTGAGGWFNGDDAVVLRRGSTIVDVIGQIGVDPGTEWGSGLASTADNTLRRKPTIEAGDADGGDPFDPADQWDGYPTDDSSDLGRHTISGGGDAAPRVESTSPANGGLDVPPDATITITFSEDVSTSAGWYAISCEISGAHTATEAGGARVYTLDPETDFSPGERCTVTIEADLVSDVDVDDPPDTMAADHSFSFTTLGPSVRIREIQDAAHISPLATSRVSRVPGIVTVKRPSSFYFQDPQPDGDVATSEGLLVFGSAAAAQVEVGDSVLVTGTVTEFRPGGVMTANLTTTELTSPSVEVVSRGNPLPAPTTIGRGGRVPPTTVIEDDASGSVEDSGVFDPDSDGIDFYESLEGMLVQVNDPVAVGPTNDFGEIPVLADNGADAGLRTSRGGIIVRPDDFNPERIILDDEVLATPDVNVRDRFTSAAIGVIDYSFGNFKLFVTNELARVDGGLRKETTGAPVRLQLSVATFNVENLDPTDGPAKFAALAAVIVNNLRSPDLLALEEVQDNNGPLNDEEVDASQTYGLLIEAIATAGGPAYDFRQINPEDDRDGGEPGGNIRVGFLFRTDRGLTFVDRPGATATTPNAVVGSGSSTRLEYSPGRIDPLNPAFNGDNPEFPTFAPSRKPLAGEFRFRGERLFVIANHFNSKSGDDPLFGRFQPPRRVTELQRHGQAAVVNGFVRNIVHANPLARVIVLGDLNDFDFSETLAIVRGRELFNLMSLLPARDRYTYVFDGNSQALDHILISWPLLLALPVYDVVHVNAEFADQTSDHDPQVGKFLLP